MPDAIDELVLARPHGGEVHGHRLAPEERDALAERWQDELFRARRRFFAAEDQAEWPPGVRPDRARHVAAGHAHANLPTPRPFGVVAVSRRPKQHRRSLQMAADPGRVVRPKRPDSLLDLLKVRARDEDGTKTVRRSRERQASTRTSRRRPALTSEVATPLRGLPEAAAWTESRLGDQHLAADRRLLLDPQPQHRKRGAADRATLRDGRAGGGPAGAGKAHPPRRAQP